MKRIVPVLATAVLGLGVLTLFVAAAGAGGPKPPKPPKISSFSPATGGAGSSVVIKGSVFTGATAVKFNGADAAGFAINSDKQITATVANHSTTGPISVTGPGGTATSKNSFQIPVVMNLNMSGTDVDSTDPAIAYGTLSWQIEYATCAKLLNYADQAGPGVLQPEVATGLPTISPDGKTYTFTVGSGYTFSDGSKVSAANFAYAINRDLNPVMSSPAVSFIKDIVGADKVINGTAKTASGVVVKKNVLTITLNNPKGDFLSILATPFLCAIPTKTPIKANGVTTLPGAGPYYIASRTVGQQIVLKRNPNYTGSRPHQVDQFTITVNTNVDQSLQQVQAGTADFDMGGLPPTAIANLASTYGVNTGRFFVNALNETDYIALNTSRPTFSTVAMRQAANYAADRPALLATRGAYAGSVTDQILPPGMPGYTNWNMYPTGGPNLTTANTLAAGGCGTVELWTSTSTVGQALAAEFKSDIEAIGCTVHVSLFNGFQLYVAAGTLGAAFDAAIVGWNMDYADPADFIDVLLNGEHIHASNNNNFAYLNVPSVNAAIDAANALTGSARSTAFGNLDHSIMTNQAPWVAYDNRNERDFISARTGGYLFSSAFATADLANFTITP